MEEHFATETVAWCGSDDWARRSTGSVSGRPTVRTTHTSCPVSRPPAMIPKTYYAYNTKKFTSRSQEISLRDHEIAERSFAGGWQAA